MQSDSGLLRWLKGFFLYNVFQEAVGAKSVRRRIIQNHVRAQPGDKVIDVGCGSAQALHFLPDVEYIGLDINPDCIAFARRTYGSNGTFVVGDTQSLRGDLRFRDVLHHLDDQDAVHCIRFAYDAIKMSGGFICLDPGWIPNQRAFSKFVMANDRGRNIRTEQQYRQLAGNIFRNVHTWVDTKSMRIPYVTVVLECEK